MNFVERIKRLKEHLSLSKLSHETQILGSPTLKDAHVYCVLNGLSAQQYGPFLEKYIITKYNYRKNHASECIGDCSKGDETLEVKASLGGAFHMKFNFVQLRVSQNVAAYLFTAYHLSAENVEREGDLYIFKIPKSEMKGLIAAHGGYAHGTIKEHGKITLESLEDVTNKKEYALRPTIKDACWNALQVYRISEEDLQ